MTIQPIQRNAAFSALAAEQPDARADSANLDLGGCIAAFAIEHRLPLFATWTPVTELGGLLAHGAPRRKLIVRAGYFVKRILDGANLGDLPVKSLGIDIPLQLQQLADQVVE